MTFKDIQQQVDTLIRKYQVGYFPPLEMMACITEECGELAREVNHLYGSKQKKPTEDSRELGQEIGDVIFALCCLANYHQIDLDQAWKQVMDKYDQRDNGRWQKK